MAIGSVGAVGGQRTADSVSRNLKAKISETERRKQELNAKQELSAEEKTKKRQELQQDLSSLNTRLKQREEDDRRAQLRKDQQEEIGSGAAQTEETAGTAKGAGNRADNAAGTAKGAENRAESAAEKAKGAGNRTESAAERAKDAGNRAESAAENVKGFQNRTGTVENTKTAQGLADEAAGSLGKPWNRTDAAEEEKKQEADREALRTVIKGESFGERTRRREAVIARMENGIVILKGEIKQDEIRGADVEKKKAELKRQEQKLKRAVSDLPDVKSPLKTADRARKRTGAAGKSLGGRQQPETFGKPETGTVKSSRDGVVIITPNVFSGADGQ